MKIEKKKLSATEKQEMIQLLHGRFMQNEKLQEDLLAGGYPATTPAAIVYKATWPEEKIFRTTLEHLHETVTENGLSKTSLIVVGDCLGDKFGSLGKGVHFEYAHRSVPDDGFGISQCLGKCGGRGRSDIERNFFRSDCRNGNDPVGCIRGEFFGDNYIGRQ